MKKLDDDTILRQAIPNDPDIKREYNRLLTLFDGADPKKLSLMRKMIARAAFLAITVDRLERDIAENGYRETYQNGAAQTGYKKSVAADLLVNYSKLYISVMRELRTAFDLNDSQELDEFDRF